MATEKTTRLKKMTRLRLVADEHREVIEDTFGEDGPWSGYREDRIEVAIHGLKLDGEVVVKVEEDLYPDDLIVLVDGQVEPGDSLYLVVVRYADGWTFGTTHGHYTLLGAFRGKAEANKLAESIRDKEYEGYRPWTGYFSSLEDVEVERVEVLS